MLLHFCTGFLAKLVIAFSVYLSVDFEPWKFVEILIVGGLVSLHLLNSHMTYTFLLHSGWYTVLVKFVVQSVNLSFGCNGQSLWKLICAN